MSLRRAALAALAVLATWISPAPPALAGEALFARTSRDLAAENAAAAGEGRRLAVLFDQRDCPSCAALKKNVLPHPAARRDFGATYRTVSVSLDDTGPLRDPRGETGSALALAARYRIAGTPAIAFIEPDGSLRYRHVGPLADVDALLLLGRFVAEGAFEVQPLAEFRAGNGQAPLLAATDPAMDLGRAAKLPLRDAAARPRPLASFRGRPLLVTFGYTSCPDVCPTTLAELAAVRRALGADAARVQVAFVTLDPARDGAAFLGRYTAGFDPGIVALRGDAATTRRLVKALALVAERRPGPNGFYTLDHTAGIFLIDAGGKLRGRHDFGAPTAELVDAVRRLLARDV